MEASDPAAAHQPSASPIIAVSGLEKEGDPQNRLLLTEQSLQIQYRGRSRAFSLEYLERIALEHRKLWLPLIGGGILASLCLLALLETFNMPYRLLAGAAIGILGVWWGYRGSMALVVYEQRHHTDFLLRDVAPSLAIFIAFSNRIIYRYPQSLGLYCIALQEQEWQQLQEQGALVLGQPLLAIPEEIALHRSPGAHKHWMAFDPFRLGGRLQWTLQERELQAHLTGTVQLHELWPL